MPLYEYECAACHRRTEKIQKFSDPEITVCPHCSGHLSRVLSAPAFSFSGGGWYADGYGSAKPAAAAAGDTPAAPASGGGSATESAKPSTPATSAPSAPTTPATAASSSGAEKK